MNSGPSLILAVQGERAERLGSRRERVFDCRDGSIGRADDCDWVLGAEGVSRLHALVRYLNGLYFVEDRSTNGMLLNGAPLRKGDPAALRHGDRLQIDTFEIDVRLGGETSGRRDDTAGRGRGEAGAAADDLAAAPREAGGAASLPLASLPSIGENRDPLDLGPLLASPGDRAGDAGRPDGLIPGARDAAVPGASLDPLALFDAPSSCFDETPAAAPAQPGWNHTPAEADRFRPPRVEAARPGAPLLPEDWDATGSRVVPREAGARADGVPSVPTPVRRGEGRESDASRHEAGAATGSPSSATHAASATDAHVAQALPSPSRWTDWLPEPGSAPDVAHDIAASEAAAAASPTPAPAPQHPDPHIEPATRPVSSVEPAPISRHDASPASVAASLPAEPPEAPPRSAAPPAPSTPAAELPALFEIAVDAMMDVLRARAELKNSFRLPATLIQRSENNPLKFAPTAQEAVRRLLAPPDNGFLAGHAALVDAADDIRHHQMAMLAGVRSAFDSLLAQFDPARIEQDAEGGARRLPLGGRPRHWERYREQFEALTRNRDECFRRLFGDAFARAYEEQLARLKPRR
ncbi:type VI secretion system-associated FHA domain protein TagH [Burkholderia plantarii]|uniref:Type VI secretion system, FHA domain-containing protein n=1 Tax=Burkholderia plantarii TaxID=41899 RepID=A0A0B6RYE4_BURPL|nr:type VI secretion system-associated FHA domain protein TagH [Burkholderia plantarii]AJK48388.1 type VI secretion system, FHA domain-containing protein [Burkholderia plantarii]